jgi:hypothetical protein
MGMSIPQSMDSDSDSDSADLVDKFERIFERSTPESVDSPATSLSEATTMIVADDSSKQ